MDRVDAGAGHCCCKVVVFSTIGSRRLSGSFFDASKASCRNPLCRALTAIREFVVRRAMNINGKRGMMEAALLGRRNEEGELHHVLQSPKPHAALVVVSGGMEHLASKLSFALASKDLRNVNSRLILPKLD